MLFERQGRPTIPMEIKRQRHAIARGRCENYRKPRSFEEGMFHDNKDCRKYPATVGNIRFLCLSYGYASNTHQWRTRTTTDIFGSRKKAEVVTGNPKAQAVGYKAKAFEARNLTFFFLIALGFPLLMGLLTFLGLLKSPGGLNDPVLIPWVLLSLPQFLGPSGAAFIVTGLTEGRPGVRDLWRRFWNRDLRLKWLLVALLLLPVLRLIAGVLTQIFSDPSYPLLIEGSISEVFVVPILSGLFSGFHEEFGWRGYALSRFQVKWNALASSIILGVITSLWHLPAFFTPGEPLFGRNFLEWLPWHMLIQIVGYAWIFNNTNGNVLALVLFHTTTSLRIFAVDMTYYGILLVAAILIVVIFGPKNLVRQEPVEGT